MQKLQRVMDVVVLDALMVSDLKTSALPQTGRLDLRLQHSLGDGEARWAWTLVSWRPLVVVDLLSRCGWPPEIDFSCCEAMGRHLSPSPFFLLAQNRIMGLCG